MELTVQEILNRQTPWDQITGCVAEGEIKDNIQYFALGNLTDDCAGIRAYRKNMFEGENKIIFGHVKFAVPEDHTGGVQTI